MKSLRALAIFVVAAIVAAVPGHAQVFGGDGSGSSSPSVTTVPYAASVAVDFTQPLQSLSLTGNVTLTSSNLSGGKNVVLQIVADGSNRTLALPGGWTFPNSAAPTTILASTTGYLYLYSWGSTDSSVAAFWSGGGSASAITSAGGTITSNGLTFSGVATDVTTGTNEDFTVTPNGTGIVNLKDLRIDSTTGTAAITNTTGAGVLRPGSFAGFGVTSASPSATTLIAYAGFGIGSNGNAGGTVSTGWYGKGMITDSTVQAAACSGGVVSIDPQALVVHLDAAGNPCVATIATTTMASIAKDSLPIRITVTTSAGAGKVTLAATNFQLTPPATCTGTGVAQGGSFLIAWDATLAKWVWLGGCQ